jgi:hypothetical protein
MENLEPNGMELSGMKNIPWNINNMEWNINRVCYYPDLSRKMLLERFYEGNHIEIEIRSEMEKLINNYSFKNKKALREMVKITWTDASY